MLRVDAVFGQRHALLHLGQELGVRHLEKLRARAVDSGVNRFTILLT